MTALRIAYLPGIVPAALRLVLLLTVLGRCRLFGDLALGARTRTEDANRALEALAAQARANADLAAAVATRDVSQLTGFETFQAAFADFLTEYGHRETTTFLLATSPTWGESPETVLGLIAALAAGPPQAGTHVRAETALRRLLEHPLGRSRRRQALVRRWVAAVRAGVAFREDSHFYLTAPLPVLRRALLEAGRRLQDRGVLADNTEVYHLRLAELEAISDPARLPDSEAERLRETVRARAARRAELTGIRLIDPRSVFPRGPVGDALVTGTPASGGTVTGRVKIINEPAEFARLRSGEVLVCPATNPSWTPLFQLAAAVVVDSGATASHAAIVAREYGIPAVMGTVNGTSLLTDGLLVTVDGDAGRVTVAADQPTDVRLV